jgi:hypothetical protein
MSTETTEEEAFDETIMEKIRIVFPSSEFNIDIKSIDSVKIQTTNGENCLSLFFYPDYIYIDLLEKCGIKGSKSLERVEQLANLLTNINYIDLIDKSSIKMCDSNIHLDSLKILTTGKSWYNSLGYFSEKYKEENSHNEAIINDIKCEKFINDIYRLNIKQISYYRDSGESIESLKQEMAKCFRWFPPPDVKMNITIKDYFKNILDDITRNIKSKGCDDEETLEKCKWLENFISMLDRLQIFIYDANLQKKISRPKGGRKRYNMKKSLKKRKKSNMKKRKKIHIKKSKKI